MGARRALPGPEPEPPARPGPWRALVGSFRHAFRGVVDTAVHQRNMRIHVVSGILVALVASGVPLGTTEQLALAFCVFLVLSAEVANSALEALVDLASRERHDRARAAKDAAAGAVLVLAACSVLVLAVVLVHVWPEIAARRSAVFRQAALGLPLAALAAALLTPSRRPRALDAALTALGLVLLAVLASFTESAPFTALAALLFGLSAAAALTR